MYATVRDYLGETAGVWGGIPANAAAHAELGTAVAEINGLVTRQEAELSGFTGRRRKARKELERLILLIANAAAAWARESGNAILLAEVALSRWKLGRFSQQVIDKVALRVSAAAAAGLPQPADYGITPAHFTALEAARLAYTEALSAPDVRRAQRSGLTKTLPTAFRKTTRLLDGRLDSLMARYRTEAPALHAGYEAARVIIDLRARGPAEEE